VLAKRKKARSSDADVVLKELLRATERAHGSNRKRWVMVGELDFPYTLTQTHAAIAVAEQEGWLIVGGKPAHSVMITPQGLKQIV
jgi:hypothetical protein